MSLPTLAAMREKSERGAAGAREGAVGDLLVEGGRAAAMMAWNSAVRSRSEEDTGSVIVVVAVLRSLRSAAALAEEYDGKSGGALERRRRIDGRERCNEKEKKPRTEWERRGRDNGGSVRHSWFGPTWRVGEVTV